MKLLDRKSIKIRQTILKLLFEAQSCHLGTCMSVVELLRTAYRWCENPRNVIVSKGHCAAAVYAILADMGCLSESQLRGYMADGSPLTGHVNHHLGLISHSTGGLGHGLAVGVGMALAERNEPVHVVLGDGECEEGSVWEAARLAAQYGTHNLTAYLDCNSFRCIDRSPVHQGQWTRQFRAFGWNVHECDGHDMKELQWAIEMLYQKHGPGIVVASTVKGKGVPFAEADVAWHHRTMTPELYRIAVADLERLAVELEN